LTSAIPDFLHRIVRRKQEELREASDSIRDLRRNATVLATERRSFRDALIASRPAIIAEIKQASPSRGLLSDDYDPARVARQYENGGAACLSVLTDRDFFRGSIEDLQSAREACRLPVLRKDFVIDERNVLEAAAAGADAILLIAAILEVRELRRFRELAAEFSMDALVEVHDADDLEKAAASGADLIGVNNRDLRTFEVNIETSLALARHIPAGAIRVSESGIDSVERVRELAEAGYEAFLIGEYLMRSPDPANALRNLRCL